MTTRLQSDTPPAGSDPRNGGRGEEAAGTAASDEGAEWGIQRRDDLNAMIAQYDRRPIADYVTLLRLEKAVCVWYGVGDSSPVPVDLESLLLLYERLQHIETAENKRSVINPLLATRAYRDRMRVLEEEGNVQILKHYIWFDKLLQRIALEVMTHEAMADQPPHPPPPPPSPPPPPPLAAANLDEDEDECEALYRSCRPQSA
jgi:hypothetical protein